MKRLLLISLLALSSWGTTAIAQNAEKPSSTQSTDNVAEQILEGADVMPEFPGGYKALMKWLSLNINYPPKAMEQGDQGRVIVRFIVFKDGSVGKASILKSATPELDQEALRLVSIMPKWKPGMNEGKRVSVSYALPVTFKLQPINIPVQIK